MRLHRAIERQIDLEFTKGPQRSRPRIFKHLAECGPCAAYYDRYLKLESGLCIQAEARAEARAEASSAPTLDRGVVSVFSVERVRSAVLGAAVKSVDEHSAVRYRRAAVAFGAVALVALVTFVFFFRGAPSVDKSPLPKDAAFAPVYIASRGGGPGEQAGFGIRVFRVAASGESVREKTRIKLQDVITFTYTRVEKGSGYLTLFGLQPSGRILWYYPGYDGERSVRIEGDKVDEPLGDGIKLSVNHEPGPLRIVSLFSDVALDKAVVESGVEALIRSDKNIEDLSPLSLDAENLKVIEFSIMVDIGDSSVEGR